jgi:hypothetical protein
MMLLQRFLHFFLYLVLFIHIQNDGIYFKRTCTAIELFINHKNYFLSQVFIQFPLILFQMNISNNLMNGLHLIKFLSSLSSYKGNIYENGNMNY